MSEFDDLLGEVEVKTRKVSVNITRTINTGNYESIKIGVSLTEDFPVNTDKQQNFDLVYEECRKALQKRVKKVTENTQ